MPSLDAKARPLWRMKRFWLGIIILASLALLSSCSGARVLMQTAPSKPKGALASPPIIAQSIEDWSAQKADIRAKLEREIYGEMPRNFETSIQARRTLAEHNYDADIEELSLITLQIIDESGGASGAPARTAERIIEYQAVLVLPKNAVADTPIIMMENFCPNHNVIPNAGVSRPANLTFSCDGDGMMSSLMTYFFGRYIATPPIRDILKAGYGLAVIYPPATFPDNAKGFEAARKAAPSSEHRWGAVAAWAYQFSTLSNALSSLGYETTIAYGHSRYGKSALVAAAFDETIDGAIAHQSGTGGASLSRGKKGETVADITQSYLHWFIPAYREDTLTIDQHHLLALIAPRPIFLGNAKRDVWSDPEGAFRAAQGATPVYNLYGQDGLRQEKLTAFEPSADIAFWMRPGTHGVVKEDWPAFLAFMDAHF